MIKRSKIIIFNVLIIVLMCLIFKVVINDRQRLVVKYYEEYTVQSGDVLETIVKQYPHKNQLGQFEYIVKDTNGLINSKVYAGQVLLIPIIEQ